MELKPCPHCGKEEMVVQSEAEIESFRDSADENIFAVICRFNEGGCGAAGGFRDTIPAAESAWNVGDGRHPKE